MAKQLQIRGGTTVQHSTFTGALREITIDTDKDVVVVHDGTTVGGFPLAKQTSVDSKVDKVTSTDNAIPRFDGTTGKLQNSLITINDGGSITKPWDFVLYNSNLNSASTSGETVLNLSYDEVNGSKIISKKVAANLTNLEFYVGYGYGNNKLVATLNHLGDLILTSGTGALGYGTGAGGTVTQLTSKLSSVTLNKPSGRITMNNAALPAGETVSFSLINNLVGITDTVLVTIAGGFSQTLGYQVWCNVGYYSAIEINVKNIYSTTLSESVIIDFKIIKGATA